MEIINSLVLDSSTGAVKQTVSDEHDVETAPNVLSPAKPEISEQSTPSLIVMAQNDADGSQVIVSEHNKDPIIKIRRERLIKPKITIPVVAHEVLEMMETDTESVHKPAKGTVNKGRHDMTISLDDEQVVVEHKIKKKSKKQMEQDHMLDMTVSFSDDTHIHTYTIRQKGKLVSDEKVSTFDDKDKSPYVMKLGNTKMTLVHTDKVLKCEFCGIEFENKHQLLSHRRYNCSNKPFACDTCEQTFTQKETLRRHKNIHLGIKPFKCDQCDESFLHRTSLIIHEQVHEGKKRYDCTFCTKKFARKCNLTVHTRLHTGERPYQCSQCDKKFVASTDLKRHISKKHNAVTQDLVEGQDVIYECSICSKKYPTQEAIERHHQEHFQEGPIKIHLADGENVIETQTEGGQTIFLVTR